MRHVKDDMEIQPQCAAMHVAPWFVDSRWMRGMVDAYRAGLLVPLAGKAVVGINDAGRPRLLYSVDDDGIATFQLNGSLMKGESKFGPSTSTVMVRRGLRVARADKDVKAGMVLIDSPGGTVSGTDELGGDLRAFAADKPLHAHGEGLVASAAYALGIQADRLTVSRMTDVGSIGVICVIHDTSGTYAKEGIAVHVVTNEGATHKGAFVEGTPVSDAALQYVQEIVDNDFAWFRDEVMGRRGMTDEKFAEVGTGRVFAAHQARKLGLIDGIGTIDQAYAALRSVVKGRDRDRAMADRSRAARVSIARSQIGT